MWVGVSVGALVSVSTSILFDCSGACTSNCVHMRLLRWVSVGVGVLCVCGCVSVCFSVCVAIVCA